jgi:hypothetical protein
MAYSSININYIAIHNLEYVQKDDMIDTWSDI